MPSRFCRGLLFLSLSLAMLSACSTLHKGATKDDTKAAGEASSGDETPQSNLVENEVSSEDVEHNIEKPYKSSYGEVALDQNTMVDKWVAYFQGRGRKYMENYLSRSSRYLPMMKNVLRENGLPEELVYVALIESGFSPRAHSHANAVGYWQFIRSTGKRFGLHVDTFTDERRDPVLSTRAAAEYFKSLYGMFGSWHLAMAAYNVGELRVKRAVTRYYTRDFWALVKKRRSLPAETKQYVPKFIAATLIAKNPEKYGFTEVEYEDPLSYDTVTLQSPISLTKLASNLSVDLEELQLLNPKFRTDFVPISRGSETVVRIPVGRATDALAALSMSVTSEPKVLQAEYYFYRIRRGDTLSTVAHKHRTTVSQLRRLNNLANRAVLRVGRSIRVPDVGGDGIRYAVEEDTRTPSSSEKASLSSSAAQTVAVPAVQVETRDASDFHVVRRGENLSTIARRYRTTTSALRRLNNLGNQTVLRRGQKLRIKVTDSTSAATPARSKSVILSQYGRPKSRLRDERTSRVGAMSLSRRHVVRRGETLYDVSRKYGVTVNELARANKITIGHRVMAGERLVIPL